MGWIIPGKPYKTLCDGRLVTIKPMTLDQRREWAERCSTIGRDDDGFAELCAMIADRIESIAGVDMPIPEFLEWQGADMILLLQRLILAGNAISEEQAKNLESSSGASTQERPPIVPTAPGGGVSSMPTA